MFDTQKALETAERIYREKETEKVKNEPFTEEESKRLTEKQKKDKKEELEKKFNELKAAYEKREAKLEEKISNLRHELAAILKEKEDERETYLSKLISLQEEYAAVENCFKPAGKAFENAIIPFLRLLNLL